MDSAVAKREFAIALLQESSIFIHLDPRREGVIVPGWLKRQPQLVLQIGLNMAVPIPDLDVNEQSVCCTLSFNRSPFFCRVPWSAIFGLVGEDGRGRIWPEDVPIEIAAQMQQQAAKEPAKEAGKPQKQQGRARLHAIKSTPPAAADKVEAPAESNATTSVSDNPEAPQAQGAAAGAEVSPVAPQPATKPSVRPSSPPGSKRELPSYLRVVK